MSKDTHVSHSHEVIRRHWNGYFAVCKTLLNTYLILFLILLFPQHQTNFEIKLGEHKWANSAKFYYMNCLVSF